MIYFVKTTINNVRHRWLSCSLFDFFFVDDDFHSLSSLGINYSYLRVDHFFHHYIPQII